MPAKRTTDLLVTLSLDEGIKPLEVGMFCKWVGEKSKELAKYAVVLEKVGTPREHLHAVLVFKKVTDQSNVRKAIMALFQPLFAGDPRWDHPKVAIDVKAHHDPAGCVGGYLSKDEERTILHLVGFDEKEMAEGKERQQKAIAKKTKHTCSKLNLLGHLIEIHEEFYLNTMDVEEQEAYASLSSTDKVEKCFRALLRKGYINYIHHWSLATRINTIKYFDDIVLHDK